jgi:hypothetical protein
VAAQAKERRVNVTLDNVLRMGFAAFFIGAGFILVSGAMEQRLGQRKKRRRGR